MSARICDGNRCTSCFDTTPCSFAWIKRGSRSEVLNRTEVSIHITKRYVCSISCQNINMKSVSEYPSPLRRQSRLQQTTVLNIFIVFHKKIRLDSSCEFTRNIKPYFLRKDKSKEKYVKIKVSSVSICIKRIHGRNNIRCCPSLPDPA